MKTIMKNAFVATVTGVLFLCVLFSCNDQHTLKQDRTADNGKMGGHAFPSDSLDQVMAKRNLKAMVFVFMTPDCPLCQGYAATLNALVDSFAGKNIELTGIIPGDAYKSEEIRSFKTNYKLRFDVISDPGYVYTGHFNAKVTPEVFVTDTAGTVVYSGRVDDWMYETGKKRMQPTEHNLRDVLTAIASGEKRTFASTQALGCIIERE